ncbi:Hypothetical protein PHPALM_6520 [Phytophthora palmivora]|uniref:Uncharacterized protein n=1 Tax=Phytophthora palmivora TaxID=4796 RepID=A0A2P4YEL0_9STRA|nr:Hypothetical protein PHPALM_6520 [Phytophthora palmivora]
MHNAPVGQMQEQRMQLLERAASSSMRCMDVRLVGKMALHCAHSVTAVKRAPASKESSDSFRARSGQGSVRLIRAVIGVLLPTPTT